MKKWILLLLAALWALGAPALADTAAPGPAVERVEVAEDRLTVTLTGCEEAPEAVPLARYGDELVEPAEATPSEDGRRVFTFDRATLPDAVLLRLGDGEPTLLWQAARPEGEAFTFEMPHIAAPRVPEIAVPEVPEIDVPKVPKPKETAAPKIEIPKIPQVKLPGATATVKPAATATPEPEAADPRVEEALAALNTPAYRKAYDALRGGETLRRGSRGDTARALQQLLVAFGENIAVDGDVGPRTLAALNAVQGRLGLPKTDSLGASDFGALLIQMQAGGNEP